MTGSAPIYVFAQYRDGHIDMTKVPSKSEAHRVLKDRYQSDGAETVKTSSSPPSQSFLTRDNVTLREYEPHTLITDHHLPLPIRKGSRI